MVEIERFCEEYVIGIKINEEFKKVFESEWGKNCDRLRVLDGVLEFWLQFDEFLQKNEDFQ